MTVVTISRVGAGGEGVGRLADGMVVFVPRTAPGDEVEIQVTESRARYARGRLVRVVRPGPGRVEPQCRHYDADSCGGCQLQHLSAPDQLAVKRAIVGDALRRIGRRQLDDPAIEPAPTAWRYRTKVTLAVEQSRIGFHPLAAPAAVFDLEDCAIAGEPLMALWHVVRARRDLLPGQLTEVVLREDRTGGMHLLASGGSEPWDARPLAAAVGSDRTSYWWRPRDGAPRIVAGARTGFPALAFAQVNPALAQRIREDAVDALGEVTGRTVWDLYGGVGDTAALLGRRGARVHSVDVDRSAVAWARVHVPGATFVAGLVEESLHRLPQPDYVVVNPPRAGLSERVTALLDAWCRTRSDARVSYVSCDPATLARDVGRMPGFNRVVVRAYDLFPQTSHVETLAVLDRE